MAPMNRGASAPVGWCSPTSVPARRVSEKFAPATHSAARYSAKWPHDALGPDMIVSPGFFFPEREDMQALFVQTVTNIEIEIGSFCNRRCGFCPNSFIDRISER